MAGVYCRISRDDGAGLGVTRQEADCRDLCARLGWQVGEVFVDNDVGAYSGRPRPSYERLMAAVRDGRVSAVVAWHPDRLHRRPVELEAFIDLVESSGVAVTTVRSGLWDLSSASGRLNARLLGAVARHESEQKSERQRRKALELAQSGAWSGGGSRPFGYDDDGVTVRPVEAAVVGEVAARILAGESLRSVVVWLNSSAGATPTGKVWTTPVVKRMVTSPRVAGLRSHRGEVVADAVWDPLLDRVTWERVRRVLLDPARDQRRGAPRRYLLTGLAVCGLCGVKLVARPKADGRKCLVCATGPNFSGCGKIRVLVEPLDGLVVDAVLARLAVAGVGARPRSVDDAALVVEVEGLERRLVELAEDWADGGLDRRSWQTARDRIERRLEGLRRRLPSGAESVAARWAGDGDLVERWPGLHIDVQRAIVSAVIARVVVGPAVRGRNTFDPRRVSLEWK